jgi:hypothetical protein
MTSQPVRETALISTSRSVARAHGTRTSIRKGRWVWLKVHLTMPKTDLKVLGHKFIRNGWGDVPVPPEKRGQIPRSEPIAFVEAAGAHATRGYRDGLASCRRRAVVPHSACCQVGEDEQPWRNDERRGPARQTALPPNLASPRVTTASAAASSRS